MGYEGHLMTEADDRAGKVESAMARLHTAHDAVGGDVVSGGGTGTYAVNQWVTEIQAGSYTLMDTHYGAAGMPFRQAIALWLTVISVDSRGRYAVADGGLKALGMDHGDPTVEGGVVWFCSDEHTTFGAAEDTALPHVGDRVRVYPAHIDPTVAYHERMHLVRGDEIVDTWEVDLRGLVITRSLKLLGCHGDKDLQRSARRCRATSAISLSTRRGVRRSSSEPYRRI